MRLLWSLPKAAPALLRHLVGYAELAGQDLEQMQRDFAARLMAAAVVGLCVFFVILTACLAVVALTWDTPHRLSAILGMGGVFVLVAAVAVAYRYQVVSAQGPFLSTVRSEWHEDRVILDRILSPDEEE
jgi:uncharacterized membrane protein YqjE